MCHAGALRAERAGLPKVAECLACHRTVLGDRPAIRRLAQQAPDAAPFDGAGRSRLADFVFFSHLRHATVDCGACHAGVSEHETGPVTAPLTMSACMDCHKERRATLVCNACHELGQ